MLKIIELSKESDLKVFKADDNKVVEVGDKVNEMVKNSSKSKKLKNKKSENLIYIQDIGAIGKSIFLIPSTKKAFNYLRQVFIKAPILQYFDLEIHIWIETNALGYIIGKVLNQLSID